MEIYTSLTPEEEEMLKKHEERKAKFEKDLDTTAAEIKEKMLTVIKHHPISDSTFRYYDIFLREIKGICNILQEQVYRQASMVPHGQKITQEQIRKIGISTPMGSKVINGSKKIG